MASTTSRGRADGSPIPIMAYYYIWFDVPSWERAKTDYPVLGRYSSDDEAVMEQHVRWAKEAGIDGFIVSWKSTYKLDRRLKQLLDVAAANDFHIWIIYQGLDFDRNPLPVSRVEHDFNLFVKMYADHPALSLYDRPVVIWSGTWEFSPQDIYSVTGNYRDQLYILASERNITGYLRLADLVDGNAYYWSSVNIDTFPGYQQKLDRMGRIVHEHGGLWVAPAAPGFDARLIGGGTVIERDGGKTLNRQLDAALRSTPDAIGLISWNEFSENSQVEPSEVYGRSSLDVLAARRASAVPKIQTFDSSAPATTQRGSLYPLLVLAGMGVLVIASIATLVVRSRNDAENLDRSA